MNFNATQRRLARQEKRERLRNRMSSDLEEPEVDYGTMEEFMETHVDPPSSLSSLSRSSTSLNIKRRKKGRGRPRKYFPQN